MNCVSRAAIWDDFRSSNTPRSIQRQETQCCSDMGKGHQRYAAQQGLFTLLCACAPETKRSLPCTSLSCMQRCTKARDHASHTPVLPALRELSFYPLPDPMGPEAANNADITQGQAPHPLSVEPWARPHLWDEKLDRI